MSWTLWKCKRFVKRDVIGLAIDYEADTPVTPCLDERLRLPLSLMKSVCFMIIGSNVFNVLVN